MSFLADLLVEEVIHGLPELDADRIAEHVALGRGLQKGGSNELG
jgi:hypothetical protein